MSNIMGYFRKSKNALEKGGITLKNTTEEKVRCPICKSYETRRAIAKQKVTCPHCGHQRRGGGRCLWDSQDSPSALCGVRDGAWLYDGQYGLCCR